MKTGMVFPKPRKHPVSSGHLEKGKGSFVLDSIDFASPKRPAALKARKTASCPGAEKQSTPPPNEMLQLTDIPKISGTLMKTLFFLIASLTMSSLLLPAKPLLRTSSPQLTPSTTLRLVFDKAVVSEDQVGSSVPNSLLRIEPPLAGTLTWVSPNVASFERGGVPSMATKYQFSLVAGLKHLDGTDIPETSFLPLLTAPFQPVVNYWRGDLRQPLCFLRFNDEIDYSAVTQPVYFIAKGGQKVEANIRQGLYRDLGNSNALGPGWKQYFQSWKSPNPASIDPATEISTALAISPAHPLPVGEDWKLVVGDGVKNRAATASTTSIIVRLIGSVSKFEVSSIRAITRLDAEPYISIGLSKKLPEDITPATLAGFITVEPTPADMSLELGPSLISIRGDFERQTKWTVTVKQGMTAADGLVMPQSISKEVHFLHLSPILAAPSYAAAQLATGSRTYSIRTVNMASARIRAKRLTGRDAVRALQGYRHYSGDGPGRTRIKQRHALPWSLVAGETIYDKSVELNNAHNITAPIEISWDDILGGDNAPGLLFLSIDGDPKNGMHSPYDRPKSTQAYIQVTDIGLAWKINKDAAFIYAYSCETGAPLANVTLDVFGEDAAPLQSTQTNDSGVALLPRTSKQRHLRASLGQDRFIIDFDSSLPTVSMWRFPVNVEWDPALPNKRTALIFTDRTLYRPGEEVHLKGLVRRIEKNLSVHEENREAQLKILDSSERILEQRDITLSDRGSFHHSFTLPAETVGSFRIELLWPEEVAAAEAIESWYDRSAHLSSAQFVHTIAVQEFRRNAFETEARFIEPVDADTTRLSLRASYFQGQPVSGGEVAWFYRSRETGFYPERFRDFLFCDHRSYDPYYWSHYFGYGESSYRRSFGTKDGKANLSEEGEALLTFDLEEIEFPSPRTVSVTSEVRDLRNQTLSVEASTTVHSSDYYVGVSRLDKLVRVGDAVNLRAIIVDSEGNLITGDPVELVLQVDREVHEQVKTRTASGTIAVRNERRIETVIKDQPFHVIPGEQVGTILPFKPKLAGRYILTLSGTDPGGRPLRTAVTQQVYGSKEYPWAYENGMLIKLIPEKKLYRPGETARILVQSPIEGTALVTLEREGVYRHVITELTAKNPVVEVPLTHEDAPNTFVSVLVIKGAKDNLREHKEPILRLGYCELAVEVVRERLDIGLKALGDYHRPGEEITIEGRISNHTGDPVGGAEVTLYAEDEGTLAVAGYINPNPVAHFYSPRSLRTEAGTSLGKILSENPGQRHSFNKGFFIGGGGDLMEYFEGKGPRRDFNPCAVWIPALTADEEGRFKVQFTAPDTLTRYRVIALAHNGAAHFGRAVSSLIVQKPLMLEPATPRFAHQGDRLQPSVLIQNSTNHTGTWDISLAVGSGSRFAEHDDKTETKSITIPAGGNATATFDLTFIATGEAEWQWTAIPRSLAGQDLDEKRRREFSDAVISTFSIEYPVPLLKETKFIKFEDPGKQHDLLNGLSDNLLEGRGAIEFEFGRSMLLEAGEALEFLLDYPYGCVEQTTSSTIPWIAALNLREKTPAFRGKKEGEIRQNIQAGVNRLLSMQCDDGGLAYWPGGKASESWGSAYGGMALLLCREAGAEVPESALEGLRRYLTGELRGAVSSRDWQTVETACRSCYTLALGGWPEVSYQNKLLETPEQLTPTSLNFLSLAVAKSGGDDAMSRARNILALEVRQPDAGSYFMSYRPAEAERLLALLNIDPESPDCTLSLEKIMAERGKRSGHWSTTWGNAWTVFALGEYARLAESSAAPPVITIETDGELQRFTLDDEMPSRRLRLPLHQGLTATATTSTGGFARVKLSSKPELAPQKPVSSNGLQITRSYFRILANGTREALAQPRTGDLIEVQLEVSMPRDGTRYLVIDDPLPSIFEAVNTDFASQAGRLKGERKWNISHQEFRDDRVLFFMNYLPTSGSYTLSYQARVTSAGSALAPPAKVEAMYEPEFFALSASHKFITPNPLKTANH